MNRRDCIFALLALSAPLYPMAQPASGMPRIGMLLGGWSSTSRHLVRAFRKGMADLGYHEGQNVRYVERYADGIDDKIDQYARELAAVKVDLIWTTGVVPAVAAQKATASIPIVFAIVADAVSAKLVHSLSTPGTNATGNTIMAPELSAKLLEILNEIIPKVRRVGVLQYPGDSSNAEQLSFAQKGALALGKELLIVEARAREEFVAAFTKLSQWRAQALLILSSALFFNQRKALLDAAREHGWPTFSSASEYAEAGGIVSYGPDFVDNCRSSADYVDKILRGAKPGELPVQQPVKFELVINVKTARAMKIVIPRSMLLRAERVIE